MNCCGQSVNPWHFAACTPVLHPLQTSIAPELTGVTSSRRSHGIIDTISRTLFGGRLIYYGPTYLSNMFGPFNLLNAHRCWVINPWAYNKAACKKLYDMTLDLITQVESEVGLKASQPQGIAADGVTDSSSLETAPGSTSNGSSGEPVSSAIGGSTVSYMAAVGTGLKQRQQQAAAAPLGVEEVNGALSAEALPAKGS